eukprot:3194916-Lingulodinium_polyedra.AAC.1
MFTSAWSAFWRARGPRVPRPAPRAQGRALCCCAALTARLDSREPGASTCHGHGHALRAVAPGGCQHPARPPEGRGPRP